MHRRNFFALFLILILIFAVGNVTAGGKQEDKQEPVEEPKEEETEAVVASTPITIQENYIVKVNDIPIFKEKIDKDFNRLIAQYMAQGMTITEEQSKEIREKVIESAIGRILILQEAKALGLEVDEQVVDQQVNKFKAQAGSDAAFNAALQQQGYTLQSFREEMRETLTVQGVIRQQLAAKMEVTEEEALIYYNSNPQQFLQPEAVEASHILIQLDPTADQAAKDAAYDKISIVKSELESGKEFAEVARQYSEGPSAPQGGALGTFPRGKMVPQFEEAAFSMSVGEVSDVVVTQFGLHIIKVTKKLEPTLIQFGQVRERLIGLLQQQKLVEETENYVNSLREKATIEYK